MNPAFDPADPAFVRDPYPAYTALRHDAPFHWHEPLGLWVVSRHRDVDALLRDRRFGRVFVAKEPWEHFEPWNLLNAHAMLELEPPAHTRLRKLTAHAFTPRRVEGLRPRVRQVVAELLDGVDAGGFDLVADLAEPLPVEVIAELLGIPAADRRHLRPWSNAIVSLYEPEPLAGSADRAVTAAREFTEYLRRLAVRRRADPGEDLFSALAVGALDGDRLSEPELIATAVLLLNAGHEASVNALGNGAVALLRQPDQLRRLVDRPELVAPAVDELLRYDTPLSLFQRTALVDVALGERGFQAGQRVGLLLGSANRDEEVFTDPDRLDVARRPNPHVAFGAGIHFCLGAPLARVELQEALAAIVARWSTLALVGEPVRRDTFQFRGFSGVRVAAA